MKKIFSALLLAVLLCVVFSGCTVEVEKEEAEPSKYNFYYMNKSETSLKKEPYNPKEETRESMVKELMQRLGNREAPEDGIPLLPGKVSPDSYDMEENVLVIDFSAQYNEMSKAREVLTRAGIAQMFLQIPDIKKIRFTVEGQDLLDSRNEKVGDMTLDSFVEFSGKDTDSYRYDTFTLYFTDKSGKKLEKEVRTVYYRQNLPRERVVLEQLAKGPMEKGHYPTIPSKSVALSAVTADRICYINMNRGFQEEALDIGENIQIYSVVNSIVDSCEADRVQISIEGSLTGNLKGSMPLYTFYEKNEELIEPEPEEEKAAEAKKN